MTYFTMLLISDMYSPITETLAWGSEHLSSVLVTALRWGWGVRSWGRDFEWGTSSSEHYDFSGLPTVPECLGASGPSRFVLQMQISGPHPKSIE